MSDYIQPTDPLVQEVVRQVAKYPLGRYLLHNVKALYYWVAFNIRYMRDEDRWGQIDYWQLPGTTISLGTGDCEDQAILLASLIRALGFPRDRVQICCGPVKWIWDGLLGYHAWIEIRLPNPTGTALALSANESVSELEGKDVALYLNNTIVYSNFTAQRVLEIQTLGWGERQGWIPLDTAFQIIPNFIPVPFDIWIWFGYWVYYAALMKAEPLWFYPDEGDYTPIFHSDILEIVSEGQYAVSILNEMMDNITMVYIHVSFSSSLTIDFKIENPQGEAVHEAENTSLHDFDLNPKDLGVYSLIFKNSHKKNVNMNLTLDYLILGLDGGGIINQTLAGEYINVSRTYDVTFTIINQQGTPLEGIEVFFDGPYGYIGTQFTDSNGRAFLWDVFEGTYSIKAYQEDVLILNASIYIDSDDSITLTAYISIAIDHIIVVDEIVFHVVTLSNSSISDQILLNKIAKKISFNVTGPPDTMGLCNVTIPHDFLGGPYTVLIDGTPVTPIKTSNSTHTSLYFLYSHTTRKVEILGTTVIPEFPVTLFIWLFMIATLVAIILGKVYFLKITKQRNNCCNRAK